VSEVLTVIQMKTRYTRLVFELMNANLALLSDSSSLTVNVNLDDQIDTFKAAFKTAGFSGDYAEELIASALVRHEMQQLRRSRKRRLIMFEKRIRQVADTVKRMASEIRMEKTVAISLEECRKVAKGDVEAVRNLKSAQYQSENEELLGELQALVNDGRTWISSAPSVSESEDEIDLTVGQHSTGGGGYDGSGSDQATAKLEEAYKMPESSAKHDRPSQSQLQDGLSWSDLLYKPAG